MKKIMFNLIIGFIFIPLQAEIYDSCYLVDFAFSMGRYTKITLPANLTIFYQLYQKYRFEKIKPSKEFRIPKIIHQIWIGGKVPQRFVDFMQSWKAHHPDWIYLLWTDEDIETFKLENKEIFHAAKNYGQKSDIWRYEILYRYGGLYVDTDFRCIKPFDILHHYYDFYAGLFAYNLPVLANGLIGSIPGHPILKKIIDLLKTVKLEKDFQQIIDTTGPGLFSKVFLELAARSPYRNIGFPCTFFYPSPHTDRTSQQGQEHYIKPESFAIHYWACSWQY